MTSRTIKFGFALLGTVVVIAAILLTNEATMNQLILIVESTVGLLLKIPIWLYIVTFIVLPVFGFPLNAYYFTITAVTGSLWLALPLAYFCIIGNMALAYFLTKSVLQKQLERQIEKRGYKVPQIEEHNEWKLIVALRISPTPWFLQNAILALAGKSLTRYLLISTPIQAIIATGIITTGASLLQGNFMIAALIFAAFFLIMLALKRLFAQTALLPSGRPNDDKLTQIAKQPIDDSAHK